MYLSPEIHIVPYVGVFLGVAQTTEGAKLNGIADFIQALTSNLAIFSCLFKNNIYQAMMQP